MLCTYDTCSEAQRVSLTRPRAYPRTETTAIPQPVQYLFAAAKGEEAELVNRSPSTDWLVNTGQCGSGSVNVLRLFAGLYRCWLMFERALAVIAPRNQKLLHMFRHDTNTHRRSLGVAVNSRLLDRLVY